MTSDCVVVDRLDATPRGPEIYWKKVLYNVKLKNDLIQSDVSQAFPAPLVSAAHVAAALSQPCDQSGACQETVCVAR